jgi:hypothetical protein
MAAVPAPQRRTAVELLLSTTFRGYKCSCRSARNTYTRSPRFHHVRRSTGVRHGHQRERPTAALTCDDAQPPRSAAWPVHVRNVEVRGSSPLTSTHVCPGQAREAFGVGFTRQSPDGRLVSVTGTVVLDRAQLAEAARLDRGAVRATVLHEVGHLVGLDHTADRTQLMFSEAQPDVRDFGGGDRRGLPTLGAQDCFPASEPPIEWGAARAGESRRGVVWLTRPRCRATVSRPARR